MKKKNPIHAILLYIVIFSMFTFKKKIKACNIFSKMIYLKYFEIFNSKNYKCKIEKLLVFNININFKEIID